MLGIHPIRMAQHLEQQGMHPVDAMIHALAHHIANTHNPQQRGPVNAGGGMIPHAIQGMFRRFNH